MPSSHLVIAVHIAWGRGLLLLVFIDSAVDFNSCQGHIRPLCTLSARLVKIQDLHITLLTASHLRRKVAAEVTRNFEDGEEEFESRIR